MANLLRMPGKAAPPPRSPEREALAAAIERRNNAVRGLDATQKALSDMQTRRTDARAAVDKAKADVETAKTETAAHLTATALGQVVDAPLTIKEARGGLQEAEDAFETVQSTIATLETNIKAWNEDLYWAKDKLEKAPKAVVHSEPAIRSLVAKFEAVKSELERRRFDLLWLSRKDLIPADLVNWGLDRLQHIPLADALPDGTAPWKAALDELAVNSGAPLPVPT
jgi:chromosome segregation ATPase